MNRIDQLFQEKKRTKQKSLIGYLMAGYPQKKSFVSLVLSLEKAGVVICLSGRGDKDMPILEKHLTL
jgi:tryptophan synthase alpha subunit